MSTEAPPEMKINALLPYFGGKRTLAPEIVAEFGPHRAYWEICCGSMAVLFEKEPASMETAIDLFGDLTNLAFVLQDDELSARLYGRLSRVIMSRELWEASARVVKSEPLADEPNIDRAFHYFVFSWIGRNGMAGTRSSNTGFSARYTKNGGHSGRRFVSAVESIPGWHHRLRPVTVMRENLFTVIPRIEDADGTVIYCDPPYLVKGASYVHDFVPADHQRLADLFGRFQKTRVIVSYYDHPALGELYPGWTRRRFEVTKALVSQGMRDKAGTTKATEVLLINGPSLVKTESGDLFNKG